MVIFLLSKLDKYFCKPHYTQLYNINADYSKGFAKFNKVSEMDIHSNSLQNETEDQKKETSHHNDPPILSRRRTIKEMTLDLDKKIVENDSQGRRQSTDAGLSRKGTVTSQLDKKIDSNVETNTISFEITSQGEVGLSRKKTVKIKDTEKTISEEKVFSKKEENENLLKENDSESNSNIKRTKSVRTYGSKPVDICAFCSKTVYPVEKIIAEKKILHMECLKCNTCGKKLTLTTYNLWNGILLFFHFRNILLSSTFFKSVCPWATWYSQKARNS